MVEAEFHLFQVQEKVAAAYAIISPEFCFCKAPKVLNAVDVPFLPARKFPIVIDPVVPVPVGDEAVIAAERIGVDRRSFGNTLPDDGAQSVSRNVGDRGSVHPAVSLENAEYHDFPRRTPAAPALPDTAEIRLINLVFPVAGWSFTLRGAHDAFAYHGVEAVRRVAIDPELAGGTGSGNFQNEIADEFIDGSVVELGPFNYFLCHEHILGQ